MMYYKRKNVFRQVEHEIGDRGSIYGNKHENKTLFGNTHGGSTGRSLRFGSGLSIGDSDTGVEILDYIENNRRAARGRNTDEQKQPVRIRMP